jgi:homoserine O-acetyltransferase/O-succinyltransferase
MHTQVYIKEEINSHVKYFTIDNFFTEQGYHFAEVNIAYHTYGKLNEAKDNVVWVCHALTANSDARDWWKGLIADNSLFDEENNYIICANILGSCYGSTGPLSINPITGLPYYHDFPAITVKDIVQVHVRLRQHLGIDKIKFLLGPSLGGQQVLEWSITESAIIENLIFVASNAVHSAWGIAYNTAQRMAIEADNTWLQNTAHAGRNGLAAARAIAMLSYRSYEGYKVSQTEKGNAQVDNFLADTYQRYQGNKLTNRFNAFSYYTLSKAMDSHNVARHRKSAAEALSKISANTLIINISSDQLFPLREQQHVAAHIPNSTLVSINSIYGHDGFLVEMKTLSTIINKHFKIKK